MGWFPKTPGGLNRYLYELSHHLSKQNDRIELCGVGLPDATDSSIAFTNLATPHSSLPQRLWSSQARFSQRQMQTPHAINLHFVLYSLPLLNQLPKDVPVTFTFHGPWAMESKQEGFGRCNIALKQWMEHQVFQRCDRFIVLSKAFGQILHEMHRVPWERIHVIPGGVDLQCFQANLSRQAAREQLGFPCDRTILFTPRRLAHRMGIDNLLTALVEVKQHVPDVWLAIAGKGKIKPQLEQQIDQLGLRDHVKLLGYVPDEQLPIAYQAADLTVVPSQSLEGFGLILLESLASGTPVLCTPVGGMPEVMTPFAPELVTETTSTDAIAARLVDLLTGTIQLPSRVACHEYVRQKFDWRAIAPQVRQVILS
jgi:glycosyltransferase involved in cell wall biosynthesis